MGGVHSSNRNNGGRMSRHEMSVKRGIVVLGGVGDDFLRPCSSAFNSFLLCFCLSLFLLVVLGYQPIHVKVFPWFLLERDKYVRALSIAVMTLQHKL